MNTSNDLAEILRVSDEFAKVNQELREDVDNFITKFAEQIGNEVIPNWEIENMGNESIRITFPADLSALNLNPRISTKHSTQRMEIVHAFCETLAGYEGQQLIEWLKNTTNRRSKLTEFVSSMP